MSTRAATAILLAGGQSTRMGTDKARLPWDGTTLLQHIHAQLCAEFDEVLLASGTPKRYADLGLNGIVDSPLAKGPMAGIIAALEAAQHEICYLHPCDTPEVSPTLIEGLFGALGPGYDAALLLRGGETSPDALPGLYRRVSGLEAFRTAGAAGQFALFRATRSLRVAEFQCNLRIANMNAPTDLPHARYTQS